MSRGPVIIDADQLDPAPGPDQAPPVPDAPQTAAMQRGLQLAAKRANPFIKLVWAALTGLIAMAIGLAAWDFVTNLVSRNQVLGWIALVLVGIVALGLILFLLRELAGLARLARIDRLQAQAAEVRRDGDRTAALSLSGRLERLCRHRDDLRLGLDALTARRDELLDADAILDLTERSLMAPLDQMARVEIETAARSVAAATALVPLALADVIVALTANIRMVRRIAEVYGGRAGTLGSWRLLRAVAMHLLATGAVAVGDDLIGSVAGGGAISKISRRFGEGVVNGALTARVGIAAIEVCRPMPFHTEKRPRVGSLVKRALAGLFGNG
ncbi:YcjF family protein [Halovulum sp. GXIMD14793]